VLGRNASVETRRLAEQYETVTRSCFVQSKSGRPAGLRGDCEGPVHIMLYESKAAAVPSWDRVANIEMF
jgi:hypothetical protein